MTRISYTPVVFIIHPGTLGDVVLSLRALQSIRSRFSDYETVLLVRREIGRVLLKMEVVGRVLDMEGPVLSELLSDDPQLDHEAGEMLSRCHHAVAWVHDRDGLLSENLKRLGVASRCIVSPHDESLLAVHQADRYCETLEHWEEETPDDRSPQSFQWRPQNPCLKGKIFDYPTGPGQQILMIHYGSGSRHKCVAPERMGTIIGRLTDGRSRKVILCQGPADSELVSALQPYIKQVPLEILKDTDLSGVVDVLREADVFVGQDSGLTHLAAALGVPTLALFGPTDPRRWGLKGAKVEILQGRNCQCQDWNAVQQCAEKICLTHSLDEIDQAVDRLLVLGPKVAHFNHMVRTQ
jgi:lipopolysaccharide heptosyltransferase III